MYTSSSWSRVYYNGYYFAAILIDDGYWINLSINNIHIVTVV